MAAGRPSSPYVGRLSTVYTFSILSSKLLLIIIMLSFLDNNEEQHVETIKEAPLNRGRLFRNDVGLYGLRTRAVGIGVAIAPKPSHRFVIE